MDFTMVSELLMPIFDYCFPISLAWALGAKAVKTCVDVISGRDLNL